MADERGQKVKRKYRPSELLKVHRVTERIGETKGKAEKEHTHTTRVRKATGKSYDEATESIKKANEPRQKRVRNEDARSIGPVRRVLKASRWRARTVSVVDRVE